MSSTRSRSPAEGRSANDPISLAQDKATAGAKLLLPTELLAFLGPRRDDPLQPFPAQAEILSAVKLPWPGIDSNDTPYPRIFTARCGRRFGKTTIGEVLLWLGLVAPDDRFGPPTIGLTADTEEHGMKIWRKFTWHMENTDLAGLVYKYEREYMRVTFVNGATVQLFSANNPNALAGEGMTLWVVDEAQYLSREAWENMYPSTSDRNGIIVMLGVAEGEGPFKEASYRGRQGGDPLYRDFCFPTTANPFIPKYAVEQARTRIYLGQPHRFRQLYLAQWVGELGKVFRNVLGCAHKDWPIYRDQEGYAFVKPHQPGHLYYGGLDLARLQDWTVYTLWDRAGNLVAWDRFNLVSWELQKARLAALSARYGHPLTVVDASGVGDPIFDDLYRKGMNVQEYKITGHTAKRTLVDELAIRLGAGQIGYPYIGVLIEELERFEAKRASENSQVIRYEAPSGMTDDFVLSCALAMQVVPAGLAETAPSAYERVAREAGAYESIG